MSRILTDRPVLPVSDAEPRPAKVQPSGLRLTGRGRLALLVLLTVAVFALISVGRVWAQADSSSGGATPTVASADGSAALGYQNWVVQPGETLWSVASAVAPDTDPRETIASIVDLNALADTSVEAGQTLLVPAG